MAKVKQGKILEVENKDRKFGANSKYFAIWTENAKKEELCLLFTENQLLRTYNAETRHIIYKNTSLYNENERPWPY